MSQLLHFSFQDNCNVLPRASVQQWVDFTLRIQNTAEQSRGWCTAHDDSIRKSTNLSHWLRNFIMKLNFSRPIIHILLAVGLVKLSPPNSSFSDWHERKEMSYNFPVELRWTLPSSLYFIFFSFKLNFRFFLSHISVNFFY